MCCGKVALFLAIFLCLQEWKKVSARERQSLDDLLNTCIDSKTHKLKPGPEDALFKQCSPWKNRSCCTPNNTVTMHDKNVHWLNFNWDHSGNLSDECRRHFVQDLCFYECSPNTGPWLKAVKMKIRNEKYFDVPLCKSQCDAWWDACRYDLTCLPNWSKGFNWTTGTNVCPTGSVHKTFNKMFGNATNFCEQVWNYSWKVVADTEPCMKIWFNGTTNPNDEIARMKAMQMLSASSSLTNSNTIISVVFLITVILL